jgi:hypothetical protein
MPTLPKKRIPPLLLYETESPTAHFEKAVVDSGMLLPLESRSSRFLMKLVEV